MKIEFTSDELYEIERWADKDSAQAIMVCAEVIPKLDLTDKEFAQKRFSDFVKGYDMYRTIAAKCQMARQEAIDK